MYSSSSNGTNNKRRSHPSPSPKHQQATPNKKSKTEDETRMPEKVLAYVPEAEAYKRLVEFERRLDATLLRKQLDVQESKQLKTARTKKILRMFIYNTYDNQEAFYRVEESGVHEPPSWTLRIEGYLLDQEVDLQRRPTSRPTKTKFSRFFRKILVQLDKEIYKPHDIIEWDKAQSHGDIDGFEIKRAGDVEINAKIILHLDYAPRHTVSTILKIGDTYFATTYCKKYLAVVDPIVIDYTIKREGNWQDYRECYDLEVEVDETIPHKHPLLSGNPASLRELSSMDDQIGKLLAEIKDHAKRRDFFTEFCIEPLVAINKLVQNQVLDYQLMAGATDSVASLTEDERHADYYYQPFTLKAVDKYLHRQTP